MNFVKILELTEFESPTHEKLGLRVAPPFLFADGKHSVSVQASKFHYCYPRKTLPYNKYIEFEVMLNIPSVDIPEFWIREYDGFDNVFSNVTGREVQRLLNALDEKYTML